MDRDREIKEKLDQAIQLEASEMGKSLDDLISIYGRRDVVTQLSSCNHWMMLEAIQDTEK